MRTTNAIALRHGEFNRRAKSQRPLPNADTAPNTSTSLLPPDGSSPSRLNSNCSLSTKLPLATGKAVLKVIGAPQAAFAHMKAASTTARLTVVSLQFLEELKSAFNWYLS